jgi:hypothetical protein
MGIGLGRDDDREARIRAVFRRLGAYYDDACFCLFLWVPMPPDASEWQILFGSGDPKDMHYFLWMDKGLKLLAEAWGVDKADLWAEVGEDAIPTGYVDFETVRGEDVPFLILPDPLPNGWNVSRVKTTIREYLHQKNLPRDVMCIYDEFKKVVSVKRRGAKPEAIQRLIGTLGDLKVYRSVESEPMIY